MMHQLKRTNKQKNKRNMKTTKTQRLIYKMLTENTGSHVLDSGGIYGRNWSRNQKKTIGDFIREDAEKIVREGDYWERTVSVFHYLSELELDEICDKFNRRNNNCQDWEGDYYGVSKRASDWLKKTYEPKDERVCNTYNHDSDLSQILQYTELELFVDGQYETYFLIQIHGGCDARGGYTDAKLFKANKWSGYIHEYLSEYMDQSEIEDYMSEIA